MRITILSLILIIAFFMNGCLVDRIKQRMYVRKLMQQQKVQVVQSFKKPKKLYTPSPAPNLEQSTKSTKKSIKKKKIVKKRVTKKSKKVIKKVTPEPYSIEKDEAAPELLGPQTTLKSNPLKDKGKI
jgi:PBP1b-binding outer membrane lipoprotein LpoB